MTLVGRAVWNWVRRSRPVGASTSAPVSTDRTSGPALSVAARRATTLSLGLVVPVPTTGAGPLQVGGLLDALDGLDGGVVAVLVPYAAVGTPPHPAQGVDALLRQDPRVRVLDADMDADTRADLGTGPRGLGDACDRGIAVVGTDLVMFVDPDAEVVPDGVAALVRSLQRTGSDLAIGATVVDDDGVRPRRRARRVTLAEAPALVTDGRPGNRVLRRELWVSAGLRLAGTDDDRRAAMTEACLRARRLDVLDAVVERTRPPDTPWQDQQVPVVVPGVGAWRATGARTLALLREHGDRGVLEAWVCHELDEAAAPYLDDVERATDDQWTELRCHLRHLEDSLGDQGWVRLRAETRVRLWLARHDRRAELVGMLPWRWFEGGNRETHVDRGRVLARLPYAGEAAVGVPDSCYEMGAVETPLVVSLQHVCWSGPRTLEIGLFAYVDHVGLTEPHVEVDLVDAGGGHGLALPVERHRDPLVNTIAAQRYQDHASGALRVSVDAGVLVEASTRLGGRPGRLPRWHLRVSLAGAGLHRAGTVTALDLRGSASALGTAALAPRAVDGHRVVLARDPHTGLRIGVEPLNGPALATAEVSGRRVGLRLERADGLTRVEARGRDGAGTVRAVCADGHADLELPTPDPGTTGQVRRWRLVGVAGDGTEQPLGWPVASTEQWCAASPDGDVVLSRSRRGDCLLVEAGMTAVLDEIVLVPGGLRVRGHWLGRSPGAACLELRSGRATTGTDLIAGIDGFESVVPVTWDEWGLGAGPVPTGGYRLALVVPGHDEVRPQVGERVRRALLHEQVGPHHRLRLVVTGQDLQVTLLPPLDDQERGPFAQETLLREHGPGAGLALDPRAVYLQSYAGESATDSPLAIAEDLRRRHPGLTLFWGVADRSARVPEHAVPVLLGSREWHRVMATATYLVSNIALDRRFTRRPGQRVLQTFHGYPGKTLAMRLWERQGFSPMRIRAELARTSGTWDAMLSPCPAIDGYLRSEYAYDGTVISTGYPRDDVLVPPAGECTRRETRARLGIEDDRTVVLYAPTWRDDQVTGRRAARSSEREDFVRATDGLDGDFVVLLRGHRYHGAHRATRSAGGARLVDVTRYPEVNDLILAADVAVLDYSSIRFDIAVTGLPMVFLVPDLDRYAGAVRGFLFDFAATAPGPLLDSAADVVARLHDLDALRDDHRAAYALLNADYNHLQDGHSAERVVDAFFGA